MVFEQFVILDCGEFNGNFVFDLVDYMCMYFVKCDFVVYFGDYIGGDCCI